MNLKLAYQSFFSRVISFIDRSVKSEKNLLRMPFLKDMRSSYIYLVFLSIAVFAAVLFLLVTPFVYLMQLLMPVSVIGCVYYFNKDKNPSVDNISNFFVLSIRQVVNILKGRALDFEYLKDCSLVYLGNGYEFKPKHSRALYDLLNDGLTSSFDIRDENTQTGSNQIHNLGKKECNDVFIKTGSLNTHTMFFGTTGTGKTKFFILQIMQAILRNEVVIVIDPKADRELKEQMIECSKLCLKEKQFYCLDLNEPDSAKQSFNLLSVCKDECKIAEQIIACISKEDDLSSDAFKSYAQNAIMNTIIALKELNYDLNFANIKNHLSLDTYYEAIKVMMIKFVASINTYYAYDYTQRFFKGIGESVTKLKTSLVEYGFDESLFSKDANKDDSLYQDSLDDETLENSTKKKRSASKYGTVLFKAQALRKLYLGLLDKYELKGEDEFISKSIETEIDGEKVVLNSPVLNLDKERDPAMPKNKVTRNLKLESLFDQCMIDETYFVKMTNSPDGLLNALSQNGFDRILNSRTNAVDLRQIYNESGILYVSLNSLVNRLRAVSVGKLILSELTSLSSLIYNADGSLNATDKRVNIFVDEAGEIITQELVMLLNKSRGANFALTLATQSYADLCKDAGEYTASKILDNCNNLICCRVNSEQTAMLISRLTGNTRKNVHSRGYSQSSDTQELLTGFNQSHSVREMDCAFFPYDAIMRLPNFEYIAKLSDGRLVKGVFPYLEKIDSKSILKELTESQRRKKQETVTKNKCSKECTDRTDSDANKGIYERASNIADKKDYSYKDEVDSKVTTSLQNSSTKAEELLSDIKNEHCFNKSHESDNRKSSSTASVLAKANESLASDDSYISHIQSDIKSSDLYDGFDDIDDILSDSGLLNNYDYENDCFIGKRSKSDEILTKEYLSGIYSRFKKKKTTYESRQEKNDLTNIEQK